MSFFKKPISNAIDVRGIKVDTLLSTNVLCPGSDVEGVLHIYGGETEKNIFHIYIDVKYKYVEYINNNKSYMDVIIQRFSIDINTVVEPNEVITIPFKFKLNENCPSSNNTNYLYVCSTLGFSKF